MFGFQLPTSCLYRSLRKDKTAIVTNIINKQEIASIVFFFRGGGVGGQDRQKAISFDHFGQKNAHFFLILLKVGGGRDEYFWRAGVVPPLILPSSYYRFVVTVLLVNHETARLLSILYFHVQMFSLPCYFNVYI